MGGMGSGVRSRGGRGKSTALERDGRRGREVKFVSNFRDEKSLLPRFLSSPFLLSRIRRLFSTAFSTPLFLLQLLLLPPPPPPLYTSRLRGGRGRRKVPNISSFSPILSYFFIWRRSCVEEQNCLLRELWDREMRALSEKSPACSRHIGYRKKGGRGRGRGRGRGAFRLESPPPSPSTYIERFVGRKRRGSGSVFCAGLAFSSRAGKNGRSVGWCRSHLLRLARRKRGHFQCKGRGRRKTSSISLRPFVLLR